MTLRRQRRRRAGRRRAPRRRAHGRRLARDVHRPGGGHGPPPGPPLLDEVVPAGLAYRRTLNVPAGTVLPRPRQHRDRRPRRPRPGRRIVSYAVEVRSYATGLASASKRESAGRGACPVPGRRIHKLPLVVPRRHLLPRRAAPTLTAAPSRGDSDPPRSGRGPRLGRRGARHALRLLFPLDLRGAVRARHRQRLAADPGARGRARRRRAAGARGRPADPGRHRALHDLRDDRLALPPRSAARRGDRRRRPARRAPRDARAASRTPPPCSTRRAASSAPTGARSSASSPRPSASSSPRRSPALERTMTARALRRRPSSTRPTRAPTGSSASTSRAGARARCASTPSRSASPSPSRCMLRAFVVEAFKIPSGSMIPTLDDRRPHLRQQVHLRPAHPVDRQAPLLPPAARARRRDGLQVPREQGAGLHQARRSPIPGDTLEAHQRPPRHQRLARPALLRRASSTTRTARPSSTSSSSATSPTSPSSTRTPTSRRCGAGREDCARGLACRSGICGIAPGPLQGRAGRGVGDGRQPQQQPRLAELARRARRGRALREHQGPRDVRVDELRPRRRHRAGPALRERARPPEAARRTRRPRSAPPSTSACASAPRSPRPRRRLPSPVTRAAAGAGTRFPPEAPPEVGFTRRRRDPA